MGPPGFRSEPAPASLLASTLRTRVTILFRKHALSVFFAFRLTLLPMSASSWLRLRRIALWLALELVFAAALLGFTAWADTSAQVHRIPTCGCLCGCGMSKTAAGCSKMCDSPKYATHRWAVTCRKPRASSPAQSDAGPRLPHPPRAERAANHKLPVIGNQ